MLDRDTVQRAQGMPVDFETYLLSSSPPASNLDLLNHALSPESLCRWQSSTTNEPNNNNNNNKEEIPNDRNITDHNDNILEFPFNKNALLTSDTHIKPIIIKKDENTSNYDNFECSSASSSGHVTPTSPCSPAGRSKRVSFADQMGLSLVTIRIMTESSDQPPCLDPDVFKSITHGAEVEVTGLPPYTLNFTQPASDYMTFQEKIEKNFVSLENVIIREYHVVGTVKVKNICFDKKVFIRCTFDCWKTSQDFVCKYVQPFGSGSSLNKFDAFSFEFDIDSQADKNQSIQFAVGYKTPVGQFWDSNDGCNYHIVPTDFSAIQSQESADPLPTSTQPTLKKGCLWTEYGCWQHVDTASPYY